MGRRALLLEIRNPYKSMNGCKTGRVRDAIEIIQKIFKITKNKNRSHLLKNENRKNNVGYTGSDR